MVNLSLPVMIDLSTLPDCKDSKSGRSVGSVRMASPVITLIWSFFWMYQ